MSHALAVAEQTAAGEPSRFQKSTRPLVWVACFDADNARALARRLVDAHFDVRVLGDRALRDGIRAAPELAVFDGDRATPQCWTVALRAHRCGTRVVVCFDDIPHIWFTRDFTVLDGCPSQTRIVEAVIHQSRRTDSPSRGPRWIA